MCPAESSPDRSRFRFPLYWPVTSGKLDRMRPPGQSKAVKFYSLYDKLWRMHVHWEAWKQVKENRGAPGVDGETIEGIVSRGEEGLMLNRLQDQLRAKTYRFQPVRRVDIPKPKGGTRPLGIATVSANCTTGQLTFGMGRDPSSFSST